MTFVVLVLRSAMYMIKRRWDSRMSTDRSNLVTLVTLVGLKTHWASSFGDFLVTLSVCDNKFCRFEGPTARQVDQIR